MPSSGEINASKKSVAKSMCGEINTHRLKPISNKIGGDLHPQ